MKENKYDKFIRGGLNSGFTDMQLDFLADWFSIPDGTEDDQTDVKTFTESMIEIQNNTAYKCNIKEPHSHLVAGRTFECEKGQEPLISKK